TDRRRAEWCTGIMDSSLILGLLFAAAVDPPVQEFLNRADVELDLLGSRRRMWFGFDHHTLAPVWRQDDSDGYRARVGSQRSMHVSGIFAGAQSAEAEGTQPTIDVECEQIGFVEGAGRGGSSARQAGITAGRDRQDEVVIGD